MSSRWYPIYQKGNPQLRVFLPNFWMKLIRDGGTHKDSPTYCSPSNRVKFHVHMDMTRFDVANYLKKIYNVDVLDVSTVIRMGRTRLARVKKNVVKDDDMKIAFVRLPEGSTFTFPEIFPQDKEETMKEDYEKQLEQISESNQKLKNLTKSAPGIPGWFAK